VTDANLLLGRYDPQRFAGGTLTLDPSAAALAMAAVAGPLGVDAGMAALGVVEIVDENMANAARVHAVESGKSFEGRTLIAFGGGGPVHAYRVAEKIGIDRVLVPTGAGVGSALGFLRAPVAYEVVRSLYQRLTRFDGAAVEALLADMAAEAASVVGGGAVRSRTAYMRYVGQGHEIPVALEAVDAETLRAAFDREYTRFYDRPVPGSDVEIMSYAVVVESPLPLAGEGWVRVGSHALGSGLGTPPSPRPSPASGRGGRKLAVLDTASGVVSEWPVYERADLTGTVHGPAIVAEAETSTLVGPGWTLTVDRHGYLDMRR